MYFFKTLAIGTVLFFCLAVAPVAASIIYSGELNLNGPNLSVDINGDGSNDFIAGWRQMGGGNGFSVVAYDAEINFDIRFLNTELTLSPGSPGVKATLEYGDLIGSSAPVGLQWSYISNDAMLWTTYDMWASPPKTYSGEWHNLSGNYLGFELIQDSNSHYGWIQLETDTFNNVLLVDYAYENLAGTPIAAGAAPVPEPSTYALFSIGMFCLYLFKNIAKT